jgi:hypothetical protein
MDQQGWVAINAENDQLGSLHAFTASYRWVRRQKYVKDRSVGLTKGYRQAPAMIFYDRPADRQPHTHTVGLCRKERVEDAVNVYRIDDPMTTHHSNRKRTYPRRVPA